MKKKNPIMRNVRDTMTIGIGSMVGMKALGSVSKIPGSNAAVNSGVMSAAGTGMLLANTAQMAKTGMGIMQPLEDISYGKKKKRR